MDDGKMNEEDRAEIKKFIDEFIMTAHDPMEELAKIILQFHRQKVALLEAEIIDLKQEVRKLKKN